ncbi:Formin-like protein 6 [Artemisia annua]|uniref:Formin-like protein n=1 Tax=Artemisia annua TaxID=35608 RepID=A0A2U1NBQ8_ARTAN|nr:Formin-like protein 6 [Artemisia annua]
MTIFCIVFDCCFNGALEQEDYKAYVGDIIGQFKETYPEYSFMILNFREGEKESRIASVLPEDIHRITIMDYPWDYEGCPLLSMEVIHHFLKSCESWLSVSQHHILLMHSELGGWPVMAFMVAALSLYKKSYAVETKALEMVHKQAPIDSLPKMLPMNPVPSQLRYLQYVSRRNGDTEWPPTEKALTLDCVIMRMIPNFDGKGGCCPVFRIYGRDPLLHVEKSPKLLFSTPRRRKSLWINFKLYYMKIGKMIYYVYPVINLGNLRIPKNPSEMFKSNNVYVRHALQAESEFVKIDINCNIQGDVVLECISLEDDMVKEKIMYRAIFNTAFIKSNILMLNRDEIDICWDAKDQFPKDFRAELLFSEMDTSASLVPLDLSCFEMEGLPVEAFSKVQEMFGSVDWFVPKSNDALNRLHQMPLYDVVNEMLETSYQKTESRNLFQTLPKRISQVKDTESKSDGVGPRSISLPKHLPSTTVANGSMKPFPLSPHIILTCAHPSVSEKLETQLKETATSSCWSGPPRSQPAHQALQTPKAPAPPAPPPPKPKSGPPPPPPPKKSGPPPPPPPSSSSSNGDVKGGDSAPPQPPPSKEAGTATPDATPAVNKGRALSKSHAMKPQSGSKLKPLHWSKINKLSQGSLWAEAQKSGEASRGPEIDMSELETYFSTTNSNPDKAAKFTAQAANKPETIKLIDHRRAYNCEIMLSKVKTPLNELMEHVLALDDSAIDVEQVDNLLKFCPTEEEVKQIKGYKGDINMLGKCEQFFLELMKVPRSKDKLKVLSYKFQFSTQIRSSVKFRRIMQTILSLGNALNQGTARGAAVGFKLDSLLKLNETRARSNKMTLMHYLCKVLADNLPELLDFSKELGSLEAASKIQLKFLAEEMHTFTNGMKSVIQEKKSCKKDGHVSKRFRKSLKRFLASAEGEVNSLMSLYNGMDKTVDSLICYFGEDPTRCSYEQAIQTLLAFVRSFNQAHEENCKQIELEKKKAQKEEKLKLQNIEAQKNKEAEKEKLELQKQANKESELLKNTNKESGLIRNTNKESRLIRNTNGNWTANPSQLGSGDVKLYKSALFCNYSAGPSLGSRIALRAKSEL